MVELTFQVTQDGTFAAEAGEVYAGEEKRTVEGDAASLEYNPFQDIENHWAKEEILKAYHGGLFQGVTGTKFVPEGKMDRAMFVTVLYASREARLWRVWRRRLRMWTRPGTMERPWHGLWSKA